MVSWARGWGQSALPPMSFNYMHMNMHMDVDMDMDMDMAHGPQLRGAYSNQTRVIFWPSRSLRR